MGSRFVGRAAARVTVAGLIAWAGVAGGGPPPSHLRVALDPNNLPFSSRSGGGFEFELARMIAHDLGRPLEVVWWSQRRGFIRNTLGAGTCDLVMGVPVTLERAAPTQPYYRSSYVFVTRRDRHLRLRSLDDPVLRTVRIGVPVVGEDYGAIPPVTALARRGIVQNVTGYSVYGDYQQPDPPTAVVRAVTDGAVDVAIAWGPLAGWYAKQSRVPLEITPIAPAARDADLPLAFDIALGLPKKNPALRDTLDRILARRRGDIRELLNRWGVPTEAATP